MSYKPLKRKYRSVLFKRYWISISLCFLVFYIATTTVAQDLNESGIKKDTIIIQGGDSLNLKSESRAFNLSFWGTIAPLPTLVFTLPGVIVGPSLGYFYGGMKGRAWLGIGIRTAGVGGIISSFIICGWDCGPGYSGYNTAWIVFVSSIGVTVISAVFDIASIKKEIRKKNKSIMNPRLTFTPKYFAHTKSVGFAFNLNL